MPLCLCCSVRGGGSGCSCGCDGGGMCGVALCCGGLRADDLPLLLLLLVCFRVDPLVFLEILWPFEGLSAGFARVWFEGCVYS